MIKLRESSQSLLQLNEEEDVHYWNAPRTDDDKPLRVDFRCACFKLNNISTVDFSVKIKFVVVFEWKDERIMNHDNIQNTNDLPRDLWGPDIILENAENDCDVIYDSFSLLDRTTGLLKRTITFHGSIYNPMDLKNFPFDWDELELQFISICNWRTLDGSRYGNDVCNRTYTLHPMTGRKDGVKFFILGWGGKIPEFQILGWSQKVTTPDVASQPLKFKFNIHLARKTHFYYLKIMSPLWLLGLTSVFAFGIDVDKFSNRLDVLFTLLLSTIAFLYIVQESIPKINHLTVIDKVVTASLISLSLAVLFSFIVYQIPDKDEAEHLNFIFSITYLLMYIIANILIIAPPHWRHNKLKAKYIAKQNLDSSDGSCIDNKSSGGERSQRMFRKNSTLKLNKSYSLGNVMNLRGSITRSITASVTTNNNTTDILNNSEVSTANADITIETLPV